MNGSTFTLRDADGKERIYDVLFTFEDRMTGKSYIVFTDNSRDENGNVQVFANTYDPNAEEPVLGAIESEEEWDMLTHLMDQIMEEARHKQGNIEEE